MKNDVNNPFKPLNEDVLDDVFGSGSSVDTKSLLLTGKKKGKRKSVLQNMEGSQQG